MKGKMVVYGTGLILAEGLKVKNLSRVKRNNKAKTDKINAKILSEYGEML